MIRAILGTFRKIGNRAAPDRKSGESPNSRSLPIDSRAVNREIRRVIWPKLKTAGFSAFTSRTAWRYGPESIDVFSFQSFNRYNADVLGVTTFSFGVNLGCHLTYIPPQWPFKMKDGLSRPEECSCEFRARLLRSFTQPENQHPHLWSIDDAGENLAACVADVDEQVPSALAWYAPLHHVENAVAFLLTRPETDQLWGFGANPSPIRSYLTGYSALRAGKNELAHEKLGDAVASGCFSKVFLSVEEALRRVS